MKKVIKIMIPSVFLIGIIIGIILCFSIEGLKENWYSFVIIPLAIGSIFALIILSFWFIFKKPKS
ncbi:hypothetical protein [Mycoplasma procyoni]|uniref:hypothetical protein n=1 Tax=Mycoplasma procyoni TaxID=568784 RepID=UPI00197B731A|nr:hypothetical protein [Mycoplasma procyoni]MBN3534607.1 hypothetical protein [Mycoplasma procyoni]